MLTSKLSRKQRTFTLPSAMKIAPLKQRLAKRGRIFMPAGWAAGPCFTPLE